MVKLNIFVCMKTIKFLLCVSIMIISGCGVRPESDSLYRWRRIHPAADSIVFALEDGFVNSVPDSLLWPLLDSLKNTTVERDAENQHRSRVLFWIEQKTWLKEKRSGTAEFCLEKLEDH